MHVTYIVLSAEGCKSTCVWIGSQYLFNIQKRSAATKFKYNVLVCNIDHTIFIIT